MIHPSALVHRLAHVGSDVEIGPRTLVWQFASVIRGARIGHDCKVASCAIVDASTLGNGVIVSHGAFVDPGMDIGDDVFVGPHVVFCNDVWPRVSKDGYDMESILNGSVIITRVLKGASLGAGVIVLPGLTIGRGAMIAAGAVVDRDVPDHHLFARARTMVEIDRHRPIRRVRAAHCDMPVGAE